MSNPLETYRWHREHIRPDAFMAKPFIDLFDYTESLQQSLQIEQQARFAAEQDAQHWREACQDALAKLERLRLASLRCPQCGSQDVRPPGDEGCECRGCGYVFDADEVKHVEDER